MLAYGYKKCFWKANGDLDCSPNYNNEQERLKPYSMFSTCQELGPYSGGGMSYTSHSGGGNMDYSNWQNPNNDFPYQGGSFDQFSEYNQNGRFYDQNGGFPATFYANQGPGQCLYSSCDADRVPRCREPSGPRIAAGGFSSDAQWVSPEYYQPPRDFDTPRNNFNHNLDSQYFNPEQKYAT